MTDLISAVSVLVAALAFLTAVSAWKREFVGKRKIELAESVLALFYEAEDAIREIRSPFGHVGEGTSRERSPGETEAESTLLDRAYVVFERYQKREQLFSQLRSLRYRFMATFGAGAGQPFDDLSRILREIFTAAQMLGRHYWPRQGRVQMTEPQFQKHLAEMHRNEAVFWITTEEEDKISPRLRTAVEITRDAVASRSGSILWWR